MKRIITALLTVLVSINVLGEETAFRRVKLADAKGKQADASLIFSDNIADHDFVSIPYDQIDKFSYDYTTDVVASAGHTNAWRRPSPRLLL